MNHEMFTVAFIDHESHSKHLNFPLHGSWDHRPPCGAAFSKGPTRAIPSLLPLGKWDMIICLLRAVLENVLRSKFPFLLRPENEFVQFFRKLFLKKLQLFFKKSLSCFCKKTWVFQKKPKALSKTKSETETKYTGYHSKCVPIMSLKKSPLPHFRANSCWK